MAADPRTTTSRAGARAIWPAWVALLGAPLVLALPFFPVIGYLAGVRGLEGAALVAAVERVALAPASVGFALIGAATWAMARRDGVSAVGLGWRPPRWADLLWGLLAGGGIATANGLWLYPLVQRYQPGFDPTLRDLPLPGAVLMLGIAALAEDSLYRGYLLQRLRARHGVWVAVLASSLGYALLTPGPDLALKVWALGFGLALAALRLFTGGLWSVVLAHLLVSLGPTLVAALGRGAAGV